MLRVVAVERYDRVQIGGRWRRVHQEDLCQAAGVHPLRKYESESGLGAAAAARLILDHCGANGAADVRAFARAIMLNYLIRGSDAHAQNYSLLITPGDVRIFRPD
jgi:serine/threonine-protein kinase HipA